MFNSCYFENNWLALIQINKCADHSFKNKLGNNKKSNLKCQTHTVTCHLYYA